MDKKRTGAPSGKPVQKKKTAASRRRARRRRQQRIKTFAAVAALVALLAGAVWGITAANADKSNTPSPVIATAEPRQIAENQNDQYSYAEINTPVPTAEPVYTPAPTPEPTHEPTPTLIPTPTPVPTPTPKPVKLKYPYEIEVDKSKQVITVFTLDKDGYYTQIVKQFICSTGHCDKVEDGWYRIGDKYRWKQMGNGSYALYASRISGPYLFHSACYYEAKINKLKVRYYEKLGTNASSGCIRLECGNAFWIYNNCPEGTPIHVITGGVRDEELLEALKPDPLINANYDPTDPEAPERYRYTPSPDTTPDPTPYPGVTPAPTPSWTVHPVLKAWGYC